MKSKSDEQKTAYYLTGKQCNSLSTMADNLDQFADTFAGLVPGHEEILGKIAGNLHGAAQIMRDINSAVVPIKASRICLRSLAITGFS